MRADVEENVVAAQYPRASIIQANLDRLGCSKAPVTHDQFGARRLEILQMRGNFSVHHGALAPANPLHICLDRTGDGAKLPGLVYKMRYSCAPNLILGG